MTKEAAYLALIAAAVKALRQAASVLPACETAADTIETAVTAIQKSKSNEERHTILYG